MNLFETMVYIDNYRHSKGIQQKDIAKQMGLSRTSLNNWNSCRKYPTMNHFVEMLDLIGLEMVIKEKEQSNE